MSLYKRRLSLKDKLRNRKNVYATWTSIGDCQVTEIFSNIDMDFVGIDIEHGTISYQQCQRIIAAAQAGGRLCLPRIDSHSMPMIKRLLDSGADGLIIPMVQTPEEVEKIIEWSKYPPKGNRSFGINRGQDYGFGFDDYVGQWNESSSLIIQIESIQGVKNIDRLLSFEDVDAVMVGPYDLSGSMGLPGQIDHPEVVAAAEEVIKSAQKHKRGCGTQDNDPKLESVKKSFDDGYTFCVLSSDIFLMWRWGQQMNHIISKIKGS